MSADPKKTIYRFIEEINARGNAGIFANEGAEAQLRAERIQLGMWLQASSRKFGLDVKDWKRPSADPPDFRVLIDENWQSLELTELVDGDFLARAKFGRENDLSYTAYAGEGFQDSQWAKVKFLNVLRKLVDRKLKRYASKNVQIDYLVICTAEAWLNSKDVESWLASYEPPECKGLIREIHFVMDYEPGCPTNYPIYRIF